MFTDQHEDEGYQTVWGPRKVLGCFLILVGTIMGFWVFMQVYTIFTAPDKLTLYQQLVSDYLETRLVIEGEEISKLVLPAEVLAYFIPIFLLLVGLAVAKMFISGGVGLLRRNVQVSSPAIGSVLSQQTGQTESRKDIS